MRNKENESYPFRKNQKAEPKVGNSSRRRALQLAKDIQESREFSLLNDEEK